MNVLPDEKLWKHPPTSLKQREALLKHGFFVGKSETYNPNSVRAYLFIL
jgi:hypothetical protein